MPMHPTSFTRRWLILLCIAVGVVFVWSAVGCHDVFTWALEVSPAVIGITVLAFTYRRFQFTSLVYTLIALHAVVLFVGGHYTYAQMPAFNWIRDAFHLSRNYYDRLGHFFQGFVPALIVREFLLRRTTLKRGLLLSFLTLCVCMAISAWYELFEFLVAELTGSAAEAFLGTQGDPWDTQWDMTFCFIGALCALIFFSRLHDRFLQRVPPESAAAAGSHA